MSKISIKLVIATLVTSVIAVSAYFVTINNTYCGVEGAAPSGFTALCSLDIHQIIAVFIAVAIIALAVIWLILLAQNGNVRKITNKTYMYALLMGTIATAATYFKVSSGDDCLLLPGLGSCTTFHGYPLAFLGSVSTNGSTQLQWFWLKLSGDIVMWFVLSVVIILLVGTIPLFSKVKK